MLRNDLIEAPDFPTDLRGHFVVLDDTSGKHPLPVLEAFAQAGINRNEVYEVQGTRPAGGIFPSIELHSSTGREIRANPNFFLVLNYVH